MTSRRAVLRAAAWTAPVALMAVSAPAIAAAHLTVLCAVAVCVGLAL